jgi:hypothetical protein
MKNIFEHTSASWVHYSDYEWRTAEDGKDYLLPAKGADPNVYDPMKVADDLVLAAVDIGLMLFHKDSEKAIKAAMRAFACRYGLLGIMTAMPTTAKFIEYEKVYFHKNQLFSAETMDTEEYLSLFFPFHKPDFRKKGVESVWNTNDRMEIALVMTYKMEPQAMVMSFMRDYGEQYKWLASVFKDWAFTLMTATLYEIDRDRLDPMTLSLYQKGLMAFDGNTPTYHLELREHSTLVWDFHSLLLNIQLLISMNMTNEKNPLKICHQCQRPFFASKADAKYCSTECRDKARKEKGKK